MKKNSPIIAALLLTISLFSSCTEVLDSALPASTCGEDTNIGAVELTADTKSYFPYTGTEKLVIKHVRTGEEIRLTNSNPVTYQYTLASGNLCYREVWDKQDVNYNTVHYTGTFANEGKRRFYFRYEARVIAEGTSKNTLNVLDYTSLQFSFDTTRTAFGSKSGQFRGVDSTKLAFYLKSKSLNQEKTMILGAKNFENVIYVLSDDTRHGIYFAQNKGFVAVKVDNEFWLLDRVE